VARVAVISDTHFPRRGRLLPAACLARIAGADLLIHAGDLADMETLGMLRALGPPLVAVHGNADDADVRRALPASAEVTLEGLNIAVTHNGGPEAGRPARLARRFPQAGIVVFGHSHVPALARDASGLVILNPGSATDRRRQPRHSMAEIVIADGRATVWFLAVDDPVGPLQVEPSGTDPDSLAVIGPPGNAWPSGEIGQSVGSG
jgi:uncharacterized protein